MHILMTNDDGYTSPLLHALSKAAAARGHRVTVCAPATQQSAKSHAFTIFDPLFANEIQIEGADEAWSITGTPVDCCRIGFMSLTKDVDLVISGINHGINAGLATYVSGTVGAAREAAFQRYPAMAVSVEYSASPEDATWFADYCIRTGEKLVTSDYPPFSVCNVNLPPIPYTQVVGAKIAPISNQIYKDTYEKRVSPRNQTYFWLKPMDQYQTPEEGSDLYLLDHGYITVSFLSPNPIDQDTYSDFPIQP